MWSAESNIEVSVTLFEALMGKHIINPLAQYLALTKYKLLVENTVMKLLFKNFKGLSLVVHTCNFSYSGDGGRGIMVQGQPRQRYKNKLLSKNKLK
jgi:hypothetical protein